MRPSPDTQPRYKTRRPFFSGIDLNRKARKIDFHSRSGCPTTQMPRHRFPPHNNTASDLLLARPAMM